MNEAAALSNLCRRVRYNIITSTTAAGSGHPSSSLSAVELTSVLFFGGFFDQNKDKFILSKGHAAPLLYSLYEVAGIITREELMTLRRFSSRLQGHPTPLVPCVDVATGSLGQGLSIGVGMALGLRKKGWVFVLMGDSEFAEGQNYEALELGTHYSLRNLIGILDVNRLGQRGETMLGWNTEVYKKRIESFGWNAIVVEDGHNIEQIMDAFNKLTTVNNKKPTMIIAKTIKGKGVPFLENQEGWHGKTVPKERLDEALKAIGPVYFNTPNPVRFKKIPALSKTANIIKTKNVFDISRTVATREAYGQALADLAKQNPSVVALDAETSNSTYAEYVKKKTPNQFFEMFIAEQNMVSVALGLSKIGYIPFVSSFAAFLTRAFDQIRMSQYSLTTNYQSPITNHQPPTTINIIGSHCGCSIGTDGASQMALEDIAMMRSIRQSAVLYPADGTSAYFLTQELALRPGINYLRTTREKTPLIYDENEKFPIGGLKVHYLSNHQSPTTKHKALIIAAGITLHEALKAQEILAEKNINTIVVDLYSVKPLDAKTLNDLAKKINHIIVVEDHYAAGGIGEAVRSALSINHLFTHLCVQKEPRSGTPEELLRYEEIDAEAIVKAI